MKKAFLLFACICYLVSCDNSSNTEKEQPVSVKVTRAEQTEISSERSYSFISQPYRTTELSFRVSGPVYTFDVQNGQFFHKGELIAAIDDRDFLIRKQQAKAIYRQMKAEFLRISSLYEKGNISGTSYEKARADYEKAKAEYENACNQLNDTRLYAPFDGYVQQVNIERFQEVKASSPVVSFIDLSRIKVEAYITEGMAMNMRQQKSPSCTVSFKSLKDKTFTPEKIFITQGTTDNNISYLFTAILNNTDNSLLGGMAGSLSIPSLISSSCLPSSVTIPQSAVCHNKETGSYVWLINGQNRVTRTPVTTGALQENNKIEILSGLSVGDRIAVTRLSSLSENKEITILD